MFVGSWNGARCTFVIENSGSRGGEVGRVTSGRSEKVTDRDFVDSNTTWLASGELSGVGSDSFTLGGLSTLASPLADPFLAPDASDMESEEIASSRASLLTCTSV